MNKRQPLSVRILALISLVLIGQLAVVLIIGLIGTPLTFQQWWSSIALMGLGVLCALAVEKIVKGD